MKPDRLTPAKRGMASARKEAEMIDEAIAESFPASDPPAITPADQLDPPRQPRDPANPVRRPTSDSSKKVEKRR
ncbi:hypothetical protein SH661x_003413 [Planctomicrobium sp. SH661]|uniref:hypothetical protein n=1 Tax=Planctomicrobium sp. SH661 TaxID=3448124 RepID=UPI003F5AF251